MRAFFPWLVCFLVPYGCCSTPPGSSSTAIANVTAADKNDYLELIAALEVDREFFTPESIELAAPKTLVLFSLTEKDIAKYDIYVFLALSYGLAERAPQRDLAIKHFTSIAHPTLRMAWAILLFNNHAANDDVIEYLQTALRSEEQARFIRESLGPDFDKFYKRLEEQGRKKG